MPILFNDGQGNFPAEGDYSLEGVVWMTAIGDVDGDHRADVIALYGPPALYLLTRFDAGAFQGRFTRDVESLGPGAVADVDLDGTDDFFMVDGAGVSLFMGSATDRFGRTPLYVGEDAAYPPLIAAHLDDGPTVDLAVQWDYSGFSLAFGNGDGTFRPIGAIDCEGARSLVSADLDLDGHTDCVVSGSSTCIALGRGDGTFAPGQDLGLAGSAGAMQIDADDYPDVLLATPDSLLAWRNRGDATFERWSAWPGGGNLLITQDLNGDGRDDVVLQRGEPGDPASPHGSRLIVRLGGNGDLGAETEYETAAEIRDVQVADLDGDGDLDLVAVHSTTDLTTLWPPEWLRGRGDGTFESPVALGLPSTGRLRFADWNGDGKLDAAWLAGKVAISLGTGGASFTAPIWLGMGYSAYDLAVGDFDGDGRPDVAVLRRHTGIDTRPDYIEFMLDRIDPVVGSGDSGPAPAGSLLIGRPAPNPMRSVMRLRFSPGAAQRVSVRVLDIAGREVRTLLQGPARRGDQEIVWDGLDGRGSRVAPGIYLLNVRTESTSGTRRVVVLN